jgi:hypothetical protein
MQHQTLKPLINVLVLPFMVMMLPSCKPNKDIAGTYRSRFAELGFFMTTIRLNHDSTLSYNFKGDLINRSAKGYFRMKGDTILLYYAWDDNDFKDILSGLPNEAQKLLKDKNALEHRESYIIGCDRLLPVNQNTGKKSARAVRYHKTKKYIIAGSHYYKDKFYLKRLRNEQLN